MDNAQKNSLGFLSAILDTIADPVFVKDRQHHWVFLNDAFCKFIGHPLIDLLGKSDYDFFPKYQADVFWEMDEAVFSSGLENVNEEEFTDADGIKHTIITKKTSYTAADGQQFLVGTIRDVTERKRMEQDILHREAELRSVADSSPYSIIRYGLDSRMTYANAPLLGYFGIPLTELIGKRPCEVWPDGRFAEIERGIAQVLETGAEVIVEFSEPTAEGEFLYHQIWIVPEIGISGEVDGIIAFGLNISERKQAEALLVQREREFRSLADNLPDNIIRYNREGVTVYVNPELERTLGNTATAMIGMTVREYHPDGSFEDYAQLLDTVLASGEAGELEKILPIPDGKTSIHQIRMVLERDENGAVVGALTTGRDITERKHLEAERLAHLCFFENMDRVNRAIQGTNDLEQMMSDVLDVVLSIFDCDRAFLVYPCDPEVVEFQIPMERTKPEYPGALTLGVAVPMGKEMAAMFRAVLSVAGPVKLGPGAEYPLPPFLSEQYDVKSEMLMALHPKHDKPWQFGLHQCSYPRVWSAANERLLQEIGRRLEEGLTSLLMQRNLQVSEQKFRSLAENMPDTLIRYDLEGRRTYINPALKRISAVRDEQMIGLMQQESNPFVMPEIYRLALEHTLATGERSELELAIPTPSGDIRTNSVFIVAEREADAQISGAITIGHDITERKRAEQQLRELTAHIQTVREEEKAHLAREIHDDLGSTLAALNLRLSHILDFEFSEDMKKTPLFTHLDSMSQILESAIASTRRIITDMRPDILDNLGLFEALKWQAEQFQKRSGIGCRVVCAYDHGCIVCKDCDYQLDNMQSINLFRIFQEALSNVARHSGASKVEAEYRPGNGVVVLSICDNGSGLTQGHTPATNSFGIRGMRERVGQLGGQIKFDSPPGGGLCVTVQLPLAADNNGTAMIAAKSNVIQG